VKSSRHSEFGWVKLWLDHRWDPQADALSSTAGPEPWLALTVGPLTPNDLAHVLGITGLQFRNWLREKKAAGHPLLAGHIKHQRYEFSRNEADQLLDEYRAETIRTKRTPSRARSSKAVLAPREHAVASSERQAVSEDRGHRVQTEWMGETAGRPIAARPVHRGRRDQSRTA
jgi:hypothetical protein